MNALQARPPMATSPVSLQDVLARPDIWRGDRLVDSPLPAIPSGFPQLDGELPGGGWPRGALTEVLLDGVGLGELSFLVPTLAAVRAAGGWSLLVAPPHPLHAPAWAAAGVDLERLAVVCPDIGKSRGLRTTDALWAAEQALSSSIPQAVLCWAEGVDARQVRRLQVAAAAGTGLAFLFRSARAAAEASVAPLRLTLSAGKGGTLAVQLIKRRGPPCHHTLMLDLPRPCRQSASHRHAIPLAGPVSAPPAPRSPRPTAFL